MISFYVCFALTMYVLIRSYLYFLKARAPIALAIAALAAIFQTCISDIYYGWNIVNFNQYAPFKGTQLFWTCSFLIIFMLITVNIIYRGFVQSKAISDLTRDLALEEARQTKSDQQLERADEQILQAEAG